MVGFLNKFENPGIKIARVNSILMTKPINLLSFCTVLGSVVTEGDFPCIVHLKRSLLFVSLLYTRKIALSCIRHNLYSLFL